MSFFSRRTFFTAFSLPAHHNAAHRQVPTIRQRFLHRDTHRQMAEPAARLRRRAHA